MRKLLIVGAVLVVVVVITMTNSGADPDAGSAGGGAVPAAEAAIPYRIVEQWKIPNGGFGRVIVIDSAHANEADLRALGDDLLRFTAADRNAVVEVFDDSLSAAHRQRGISGDLPKLEQQRFDRHKVADYTRNANTGFNQFTLTPDGIDGRVIEVKY
jgi:hypothetical protein